MKLLMVSSCCFLVILMAAMIKSSAVDLQSIDENTKDLEMEARPGCNSVSQGDCTGCQLNQVCHKPCWGSSGGKCIQKPGGAPGELICCHANCKDGDKCSKHKQCVASCDAGGCCDLCNDATNPCTPEDCQNPCPFGKKCKCLGSGTCQCICDPSTCLSTPTVACPFGAHCVGTECVCNPCTSCQLDNGQCNSVQCDSFAQECQCIAANGPCGCVCNQETCGPPSGTCPNGGTCDPITKQCICNPCNCAACGILGGTCNGNQCTCNQCTSVVPCDKDTCLNGEDPCPKDTTCTCVSGKCTCVPNSGCVGGGCETSITINIASCGDVEETCSAP